MHNNIKEGLKDGIPIALGYFSVSFTFGMLAVNSGMAPLHAVLISLFNLTSAGQFAGLNVILSGASLLEMALTQLVINMRYALMSLSLSQKFDSCVKTRHRLLIAYGNTDEIFAVASSKRGSVGQYYMYGLILLPVLGWCEYSRAGSGVGRGNADRSHSEHGYARLCAQRFGCGAVWNVYSNCSPTGKKRIHSADCGIYCAGPEQYGLLSPGTQTGFRRIYDHYLYTAGSGDRSCSISY